MIIKGIKMAENNTPSKRNNEPYLRLTLDGGKEFNRNGFDLFMDANRTVLYKNILNLFKGLRTTRKKTLKLVVISKIIEFEWKTTYSYGKKDSITLVRDMLPYFESIEDYETCMEIVKVYNELN
jgi:hypothetical protein